MRLVGELRGWSELDGSLAPEEVVAALERTDVRRASASETGRVAVLDLLRARTRRFEIVFVLGLEEGSLPRRGHESPFLGDDARRELDERRAPGWPGPTGRTRPLPLLHGVHAGEQRLYLVREAATDEGSPREPSPFWDEVAGGVRPGRRRALDAPPPAVRADLAAGGGANGARAPARGRCARRATTAPRRRDCAANGWDRRLARALSAFERPTRITHPQVLAELSAKTTFGVTELERFADCSSIWFIERLLDPKSIDARVDARLRGSIAHQTLLPLLLRTAQGARRRPRRARPRRRRTCLLARCLDDRGRRSAHGADRPAAARAPSRAMARPRSVRPRGGSRETCHSFRAASRCSSARSAPRPSCSAGSSSPTGSHSRGRSTGSTSTRTAREASSRTTRPGKHAHSAAQIEQEKKLQIPLYMLVLRDLVGIEPLGGLYRPLAGERKARGLLRAGARDDGMPGFAQERLSRRRTHSGRRSSARASRAADIVERIRTGDVQHDPKGGDCPTVVRARADVPDQARMKLNVATRTPRSAPAGSSSSPPAPAPARRRCSSSASRARSATKASTSTRSS